MKATIDFDEALYRRLKVEAAKRGRSIRDLVADGVRYVLSNPTSPEASSAASTSASWVGSLRSYAKHADGKHDMASIRKSIAKGRKGAP